MKLIKLSIWALLILALIPTTQGNRYSLYTIFSGAVQDMGGFCERKPDVCKHAGNVIYSLKDKIIYIGSVISGSFSDPSTFKTAAIDNATEQQNQDNDTKLDVKAPKQALADNQAPKQTLADDNDFMSDANKNTDDGPIDLSKRIPLKKANFKHFKQEYSSDTLNAADREAEWQGPVSNVGSNDKNT